MLKPKLFLLDANSFCYRAFFAIKAGLATSYGQPTGAIFGFLNILKKILKENNPEYLGVCFDISRDTFRKDKFADYKKNRPAVPEELLSQMSIIKEVISAYNFHIFEKEGFEADDLIATIAKKAKEKLRVFIVSPDKDMLQLVDDNIKIYNPYHSKPLIDTQAVLERFGISPSQIIDIVALTGDVIDNIPGIKGIGEKTAIKLIKEYKNIENIILNIEKLYPIRLRQILKEQKDSLSLSKELALLDMNVPLELDFDKLKVEEPDYARLQKIFKRLEFTSLLKTLPFKDDSPNLTSLIKLGTLEKVIDFVNKIKNKAELVFFAALDKDGGMGKICFYDEGIAYYIEPDFYSEFKDIFLNSEIKKISYDFKTAKAVFKKYNLEINGVFFDILLAAYILDPARHSYELNDLAAEYLDVAQSLNPVICIVKLREVLGERLKEKKQDSLFYDMEMPLLEVLSDMESVGINIDLGVLSSLSKELDARISSLMGEIYALAGDNFNINSPKQLRLILFDKLKLAIIKKTKTGPSTDEEVLRKLSKDSPLPKLILDYRQLLKLKSTYVDALPKLVDEKDGRLHTSFNQTGTETGRLSSSDPNLQNIPVKTEEGRRIRLAFIPGKPNDYLVACDYSQVELRILAHLSHDRVLTAAFSDDLDVHRHTASLIFSVDEDKVSQEMRDIAKRVNFGIIYGITSYGLSKDLDISNEEAQKFIDEYFLRYPDVKKYIDEMIKNARKDGFVTTLLGRRRYLPQINSDNVQLRMFAERQAINAPIQGTASDMIKLAMVNIQREFKKKALKSRMVLQVHDELIFDVDRHELAEVNKMVKGEMESVLKLSVPIKVEIRAGRSWYKMEPIIQAGAKE